MIRFFHKYLSLIISIQLLLWSVSGFYFDFNKIELVRGEQYLLENQAVDLNLEEVEITFTAKNLSFIKRLDMWIIKAETDSGLIYSDLSGKKLEALDEEEAKEVVKRKTNLRPLEAFRIDKPEKRAEYRGRDLPLYKVTTSASDGINVYVDAFSGAVTAIRSDSWRIWDFLWGAHIIDYRERDNINNFLLKFFSILALISALSGIALFFKTLRLRS